MLTQISTFRAAKGTGKRRAGGKKCSTTQLVRCYMPAWLPTAFCRLGLGDSLGQTDALMPLLLWNAHASSQMPIKDNGHSNVRISLSWWLYPTDNRLGLSDKWLELNCLAKCKYASAEMENYHKIFRTAGNFKANLCIRLKLQSPR